jgi:hypothetical protein
MNTEVDLNKLHDAIVADIRAKFPSLQTVEFYYGDSVPGDRSRLQTPACLLSLTEFEKEPEEDPGTEQLPVLAHFEAELVLSFKTLNPKKQIRLLAAAFSAWVHDRRWRDPDNPDKTLATGAAVVVGAYPDDFAGMSSGQKDKPLDQFEIWRVEWRQQIDLGESVWADDNAGEPPAEVFVRPSVDGNPCGDFVQVIP